MTKLFVVLLVVGVALWALLARSRGSRPGGRRDDRAAAAPPPPGAAGRAAQDMVRCARCGLHLPAADAVQAGGQAYCGAEHASAVVERAPSNSESRRGC